MIKISIDIIVIKIKLNNYFINLKLFIPLTYYRIRFDKCLIIKF